MKKVLIIGAGMGGLSTALRLSSLGYQVQVIEKNDRPGGRLNLIDMDGFKFDQGPSFMSMTYEFEELFQSCGIPNPITMQELDPVYQIYFEGRQRPYKLFKDLSKLSGEFEDIEQDVSAKAEKYLKKAEEFFHDTEDKAVKRNFDNILDYYFQLAKVPKKHLPYLFKSMWSNVADHFESDELRMLFSLVAFFLGTTPFKTPAIYSLLNYVELQHNGYWSVDGGMYAVVEHMMRILKDRGVDFVFNQEITDVIGNNGTVDCVRSWNGIEYRADIYVCNSDAAAFRGEALKRKKYAPQKLDKLNWGMAPFTVYLGVKGKIDQLLHHNYFLGSRFTEYAKTIFTLTSSPEKPYYYVNVPSKTWPQCAPEGYENLFILCPMPDLRYKKDWSDKESLAENIIRDFETRIGYDVSSNIIAKRILTPYDWKEMFRLPNGSGLSLCHDLNLIGIHRPKNKDEEFKNLYYVGASTVPGTGLPMVIIGSKLVTERIQNDYAKIS